MADPEVRPEGRSTPPRRDLAAVPSFLRERDGGPLAGTRPERPVRLAALPKPQNPPPPAVAEGPPALDPASLPMPSLSRRRLFTMAGVLLAGWLALSFARQVGEASAATYRADELRDANAALRAEIARLEADLGRVQDRNYILQQGRGFGLGGRHEIAFALGGDAPALRPDAPGSAATRLGSSAATERPIDVWLEVLFGGS
jgi:hypothetical protein